MDFQYNTNEADNKYAAFAAAQTRNVINKMNHSAANIKTAQSLARMLEQCVACDKVYVNYTKKMVTVKVQNFRGASDKQMFNDINDDCKVQGIEIGTTAATSLIYHIFK